MKKEVSFQSFLLETPTSKRLVPAILIHCDSTTVIAKVHKGYYNDKRRHIRRKHSTIEKYITIGVVIMNHVWCDDNLVDSLTKGLARENVFKT